VPTLWHPWLDLGIQHACVCVRECNGPQSESPIALARVRVGLQTRKPHHLFHAHAFSQGFSARKAASTAISIIIRLAPAPDEMKFESSRNNLHRCRRSRSKLNEAVTSHSRTIILITLSAVGNHVSCAELALRLLCCIFDLRP
jgi:hypothetical protein